MTTTNTQFYYTQRAIADSDGNATRAVYARAFREGADAEVLLALAADAGAENVLDPVAMGDAARLYKLYDDQCSKEVVCRPSEIKEEARDWLIEGEWWGGGEKVPASVFTEVFWSCSATNEGGSLWDVLHPPEPDHYLFPDGHDWRDDSGGTINDDAADAVCAICGLRREHLDVRHGDWSRDLVWRQRRYFWPKEEDAKN